MSRITGVVSDKGLHYNYGFINCFDGRIYATFDNLPFDEVGRKWLAAFEKVEFELRQDLRGRPFAADIEILSEREPVDILTFREVGKVSRVNAAGDFAFLERSWLGHNSFLHINNCVPDSPALEVGQYWHYGVRRPEPGNEAWLAVEAEFVPREELFPIEAS
jgi:cold shock CspA family protein